LRALSRLFEYALSLSAWKQAGGTRWALRMNPSSGNLHPTEGYVLIDVSDETSRRCCVSSGSRVTGAPSKRRKGSNWLAQSSRPGPGAKRAKWCFVRSW
jgi:hypothetical protein